MLQDGSGFVQSENRVGTGGVFMQAHFHRLRNRMFADPWRFAFFVLAALALAAVVALVSFWLSVTEPHPKTGSQPATGTMRVPIDASVSLNAINQYVGMQLSQKETPVQNAKISFDRQR